MKIIRNKVEESSKVELQDITEPEYLEILIKEDGKVVWINIDGICAFRACRIKKLILNDERNNESTNTNTSASK